jgi:Uma2 family endonuclease
MSAPTTTKRMTAEEFYEFVHRPENVDRCFELVRGEVIEVSRPTRPHGVVCVRVGRLLDAYAEQRGSGYVTSNDSGVILEREPDTVRGPDVAFYEDAATFDELHPNYGEVPPLLAVEVLSPNDKPGKVMNKITNYLRSGVRLVWVLDPEARQVFVHQPDKALRELNQGDEITGEDILPGFRCRVADFFHLPGEKAVTPSPPPPPRPSAPSSPSG